MKKILLASGILVAASSIQFVQASTGNINFTGGLTTATCSINGGGGSDLDVDLGLVSIDDLNDGSAAAGANTRITVDIDCTAATGLSNVYMNFDPRSGSGSGSGQDSRDSRLLKTEGDATGVGIGLINGANQILDMRAGDTITEPLTVAADGTARASLDLRAAYVVNGDPVVAGEANATLPFTFTYD